MFTGVFNAALNVFNDLSWGTICPTYYCESARTDRFDLVNDMNELITDFANYLVPIVRDGFNMSLVNYRTLEGDLGVNGLDELNLILSGGGAGVYPYEASVLIKKYAGSPAEYKKGRFYVPFPKDSLFGDGDLVIPDGDVTAFCAFASTAISYGSTDFYPVVRNTMAGAFDYVDHMEPANYMTRRKWRQVNHGHRGL